MLKTLNIARFCESCEMLFVLTLTVVPIYGLKMADFGTDKRLNWNAVAVQ